MKIRLFLTASVVIISIFSLLAQPGDPGDPGGGPGGGEPVPLAGIGILLVAGMILGVWRMVEIRKRKIDKQTI
jgi:hypothetical protein